MTAKRWLQRQRGSVSAKRFHYYCQNCHDYFLTSEPRGHDACSHCDMDTVREILVRFEFPPIPLRSFDYCALFDGEEERREYGWGTSAAEAVNDLLANYGDAS